MKKNFISEWQFKNVMISSYFASASSLLVLLIAKNYQMNIDLWEICLLFSALSVPLAKAPNFWIYGVVMLQNIAASFGVLLPTLLLIG